MLVTELSDSTAARISRALLSVAWMAVV